MFTALRFKNPYESMAIDVFKTYSTNFPEDLSVFLDFPFTLPDPNNLDCDRLDDSLFFLFFCFKAPGSCRTIVSSFLIANDWGGVHQHPGFPLKIR